MRLLVPLFHDDSYASMLRNYRLFRLIVFRNFTAVCERVCEQMRVNDANTRVCCNYPQLKFATTLFVPTRSGNRGNEYLYSFFLSFFFSFSVSRRCRSSRWMESVRRGEEENKVLRS